MRLSVGAATVYLLCLLLGLVFALLLIPIDTMLALHTLGQSFVGDDRIQHVVGERYFIADAWRWPLLIAEPLDWPDGTNISLTDSIPLLAIAAKLLRGWLPPGFHAIFLWLAIAHVCQPVAAAFALRSAGERRLVPALAVAVMALSMPTFLYRFGHAALSGHFLILLALGTYLRVTAGSRRAAWLGPVTLLPVSLLVHPYLMAMVAALLAAAPLSLLLSGRREWRAAAWGLSAGLAVLAVIGWVGGYGGRIPQEGYGLYAMDLLSPFRPDGSALLPNAGVTDGVRVEGYQYLGVGLFLLLAVALVRGGRTWRSLRHHKGLVLMACALTVLAISTRVQIGGQVILDITHFPRILQQFRASGRLFWPVTYSLLMGAFVMVMRSVATPLSFAIVVTAALLQFADASLLRGQVHDDVRLVPHWQVDAAVLRPLLASHRSLTLWPPFGCGSDVILDPGFMETLLLASESGIRTNTMYVARRSGDTDCSALRHVAVPLAPGELRVFLSQVAAGAPAMVPDGELLCRRLGSLAVCSAAPLPGLAPIAPATVATGEVLAIGTPGADAALGAGWGPLEPTGIWTEGGRASLTMRRPAPGALHLTMWGHAYAPAAPHRQMVTVFAGARDIATWSVAPGADQQFEADIPADDAVRLNLRLDVGAPTRPVDIGDGPDVRSLGFYLSRYRLAAAP